MRGLRPLWLRLVDPWRWRTRERDLGEEIEAHLTHHIDDNLRAGMSHDEARRHALLKLGGVEQLKERYRDQRRLPVLETLIQDVRYGIRLLNRHRGVSAVIAASLALGIGANTAMFSILNAVLLRSLPVRDAHQLAIVAQDEDRDSWTYAIWEQLQARQHHFAGALAWAGTRLTTSDAGQTRRLRGVYVSGGFFDVLGTPAALGRTFTPADDRRGGGPDGPVAVISYRFWQERFAGSPAAIGASMVIERVPFIVIGVTPPDFFGVEVGQTFDVAIPFGTEPLVRGQRESLLDHRSASWLTVMIRMKPDQDLTAATATLRTFQPQVREAVLPTDFRPHDLKSFFTTPLILTPAANGASYLRYRYQTGLTILMAVVVLVLLIACANIANLLLARANARRHEFSVRLALGASRLRICRQLLAESLVLAFAGAALGLVLAKWSSASLVSLLSTRSYEVFLDLPLDWRVVAFTTVAATLTAVLFGLAPALQASRVEPSDAMKEQGRSLAGARSGGGRGRLVNLLVAIQVALSLVLVVGATLFVGTLVRLIRVPLGFEPRQVLMAHVEMRGDDVAQDEREALLERLREAAANVPGVASATLSVISPVSGETWSYRLDPTDFPGLSDGARSVRVNFVGPDFFRTYGTPLVAGREFGRADSAAAAPVAIVNEAFARTFFGGTSPLGRTVRRWAGPNETEAPREVVGFVADAVYRTLREPAPPTMYIPLAQHPRTGSSTLISVRVQAGSPASASLATSLSTAIRDIAPAAATTFVPLADQVRQSLVQERLLASLSAFFGALGLLLAGLGLYGVTSQAVTQRRTEMGLRMALGAAPRQVIALVLSRVFRMVIAGVIAGAAMAMWASRFVAALLYGVQPDDPVVIVEAIALLGAIGLAAGVVPAWRATRVEPGRVLHDG